MNKSVMYRQKLQGLFKKQNDLLRVFMDDKPLLKGLIYKYKTKCGCPGCKCNRLGKLHQIYRFTKSIDGKTRNRCISFNEVLKYEPFTKNYLKFRNARAELVRLNKEQIKLVNLLEESLISDMYDKDIKQRDKQMARAKYYKPRKVG